MKFVRYIFYLEILVNLLSGFQTLFTPSTFMAQFSSLPVTAPAAEMARWYGVLICVVNWLLFRALQRRGPALKLALEAYLVGDILQIVVSFVSASTLGWTGNIVLSVVISLLLGVARMICLWKPVETGIE